MSTVAVIAHTGKTLDGGLPSLGRALDPGRRTNRSGGGAQESAGAGAGAARLEQGADLVFVWGGDGMVQRCVDVVAGSDASLAIVPAGHRESVRLDLGTPQAHRSAAVEVGLHGDARRLDLGRFNGETIRGHGRRRLRCRRDPGCNPR